MSDTIHFIIYYYINIKIQMNIQILEYQWELFNDNVNVNVRLSVYSIGAYKRERFGYIKEHLYDQ